MTEAEIQRALVNYEGLIFTTAIQIAEAGVQIEVDDLRSMLRVKAWKAIISFSPTRAAGSKHLSHAKDKRGRSPLDRFVFMCITNFRKDLEDRPRRYHSSYDYMRSMETAADRFDARYCSASHDEVYGVVEEAQALDDLTLLATFSAEEREVVKLAYEGLLMREIDQRLSLSRARREEIFRSIRAKMGDWRPTRAHVPTPPLLQPAQPVPQARVAQAV